MPSDAHAPAVDLTGAADAPKAAAPERKTIRWTEERDVALLTQICSAGVKSFVTNKANDNVSAKKKGKKLEEKPVEPWNVEAAWTNEVDGIITMLQGAFSGEGQIFCGVKWPGYQSILSHVITKGTGLLAKHSHLYTEGQEQVYCPPS